MRLVVCLVFLASFALVCQAQGYQGGYTRPFPRPPYGGGYHPVPVCTSCHRLSPLQARACCRQLRRCCDAKQTYG
ncbi:penaeidin-2b-like [Penaeus monodon]|uniref:Penaeidin n=1 Tax=Penaeus monodon TaxID=6687 RepID=C4NYP6_PENMO|nr:penaeidin-2b-like [Penaeus monodon]ACQ66007.1 penaeidin 3b antimicrobial peptide [Penaeus monodon]AGB56166.1 penaeidin [Penaeus monodon]WOP35332.1 penaeidin 3 [Penaeus monodon]